MTSIVFRSLVVAAGLICGQAVLAGAQAVGTSKTVLTLTGKIEAARDGGVDLALADLLNLPQKSLTLKRIWEQTPTTFTGPLLRDVLAAYKARGQTVTARSLGNEAIQITMQYLNANDVIVAFKGTDPQAWLQTNSALFLVYPSEPSSAQNLAKPMNVPSNNTFQLRSLQVE